jgi:AbrB family looped-hinge helix DNA binding protein
MSDTAEATMTSKGQVTIPSLVRKRLGVKPGDKLTFSIGPDGTVSLRVRKRLSILDIAREHPLPRSKTPFVNEDVDKAVTAAMSEQESRTKRVRRRA